ncbi:MAG: polymer-forming cytoskeletal protein [Alphaproteobacteria bacterium]|nr:polymer-forming cytoskeletal protein [Alphaproteobacteria bacterium]
MFTKTSQRGDGPVPGHEPVERALAPVRSGVNQAGSLISAELKIVGNLDSNGDLRVDGTVEGDIASRSLTVGEGARIDGSIAAETVQINGTVSGHIKGGSVIIARTARVTGDVTYVTLAVEEGGVLEGQCRRAETNNVAKLRAPAMPKPAEQAAGH